MSGIFGLVWTVLLLFIPTAPASIFGWLCVGALVIACFLAWEEEHRKAAAASQELASQFDPELVAYAKSVIAGLSEFQRTGLKALAVRGAIPADELPGIESTGMVQRDPIIGNYHLSPEYKRIVPKILKGEL